MTIVKIIAFQMKDEHIASKDKEILNKTDLVQQQLNEIVKKDDGCLDKKPKGVQRVIFIWSVTRKPYPPWIFFGSKRLLPKSAFQ